MTYEDIVRFVYTRCRQAEGDQLFCEEVFDYVMNLYGDVLTCDLTTQASSHSPEAHQ